MRSSHFHFVTSIGACLLLAACSSGSGEPISTDGDSVPLVRCDPASTVACGPGEACLATSAGSVCVAGGCTTSSDCTAGYVCREDACARVDDSTTTTGCPPGTAAGTSTGTTLACPDGTAAHPATIDGACWSCERRCLGCGPTTADDAGTASGCVGGDPSCTTTTPGDGSGDGSAAGDGSGGDSGSGGSAGGTGTVVSCGTHVCGDGEYCCNPSCGICAPVGDSCITIVCSGGE